jgi:anthranilate phosphoribosyltransferase
VSSYEVSPEELGMARVPLETLRAGSIDESVRIMRDVLGGGIGPTREVVLMNAGAALLAAEKVQSLTEGAALAAESIDSGRAGKKLDAFVKLSTSLE